MMNRAFLCPNTLQQNASVDVDFEAFADWFLIKKYNNQNLISLKYFVIG
jgi:hypothetical protein